MLIMTKDKKEIAKGIKLPNNESIRTLEGKENSKYVGILEMDIIKQR